MHQTVTAQSTRGGDEGSSGRVVRARIGGHRQGGQGWGSQRSSESYEGSSGSPGKAPDPARGAVCQEGFSEEGMSEQDERN